MEALSPNERPSWARALSSRPLRYLLIGPSVLSVLAQFEDIGRFSQWLTSGWAVWRRRVLDWLGDWLPESFNNYEAVLFALLIFSPLFVLGVLEARKPHSTVSVWTATASCLGWSLLLVEAVNDPTTPSWLPFALGPVIAVMVLAPALLASLIVWRRWRIGPIQLFAIATVMLAGLSVLMMADDVPDIPGMPLLVPLLAAPFITPRRLRDLALIVCGITAISLAYEGVARFLPV